MDAQERLMLLGTVAAGVMAMVYALAARRCAPVMRRAADVFFGLYAFLQIGIIAVLWVNHVQFPLNLEAMELTILQHVKRAAHGIPIYTPPAADFIALDYTPLYYYLCAPFTWVLGERLFTLRLVSILGMFGAGTLVFLAVRRRTDSAWWGLLAVGLFAAAYRAMDSYLDVALPDSWLIFVILAGSYLIDLNRSRRLNLLGLALVISGFWFKQYGAIFAVGVVLFLTWRDGWRDSWPYWLEAVLLGPVLYLLAPIELFGPEFHYFTWEVPRRWMQFDWNITVVKFAKYFIKYYLWLGLAAAAGFLLTLGERRLQDSIWFFMLPVAIANGLFVSLDPGRNNNVFIPLGVWLIVTGSLGVYHLAEEHAWVIRWGVKMFLIAASFALFFYDPRSTLVSPQARTNYQDLQAYLAGLDGSVYAPWIGQLQDGYRFSPAAHWIALTDLFRDSTWNLNNHPVTREVLAPVVNPTRTAYILMDSRLEEDPALRFLAGQYTLVVDFGERFAGLANLPRLLGVSYPKYLYRYEP